MNYHEEVEYITTIIKDYFKNVPTANAILGISGGADSTIVAMFLVHALGKEKVLGILMPNGVQPDIKDSLYVCRALGISHTTKNIGKAYEGILENAVFSPKTKTNIAPRLRMTTLYAYAQERNALVVGTGNGSENYVGWCTKHADTASDGLAPLLPYTKIEVIELGKVLVTLLFQKNSSIYAKMLSLVTKAPSDGLTSKTDEENLGFTYHQLHDYQRKGTSGNADIDKKIETMHHNTAHKRNKDTVPTTSLFHQ